MISDNKNAGNQNRFVPSAFPLKGSANYGGGEQFSMNANATQLRLDVRAPDFADGSFRFYYQNDFFGSGSDTVDCEGPNSVLFSRRPVAQYTYAWNNNWNTTFGIEKPDTYIDTASGPNTGGSTLHRMPDLGFNTRYEKEGFGHLQFSTLFRDLGVQDSLGQEHHVFGWGVNLGEGLDLGKKDSVQLLGVYGAGVGGQGNDSGFLNSDAAFDTRGNLEALPYWSGMVGYTHRWNSDFRSTASYGYVNLDNASGQVETFYHTSQYASANLVWQLRKRLSIGLEGLYGIKEARNGVDSGDHWRVQVGMVYSLFD